MVKLFMARKPDREKHTRQDKTRKPDYREEMILSSRGPSSSLDFNKLKAIRLKELEREAKRKANEQIIRMVEVGKARRMDIVICPALGSWMETNQIDLTRLRNGIKSVIVAAAGHGDSKVLIRTVPGKFWNFNLKAASRLEKDSSFEIKKMPIEFVSWLLKFKQKPAAPPSSVALKS